jgi:carbon storage regulator CsrA
MKGSSMLVMTRRTDETIKVIQNGKVIAEIQIVQVKGSSVRVGITAGTDVRILRGELDEKPE